MGDGISDGLLPVGELLRERRRAQIDLELAQTELLQALEMHRERKTYLRVVGLCASITAPRYDEKGNFLSYAQVSYGPIIRHEEDKPEPVVIESGTVKDITRDMFRIMVSVEPVDSKASWNFPLDRIHEIEEVQVTQTV